MLLNIFLSITHQIVSTPTPISPILMQYLMMLIMGGAAYLSKKQLKKTARKMKWQILKEMVKNTFYANNKSKNRVKVIILLILLIGLVIGIISWLGWAAGIIAILLAIGFGSQLAKNR